MIFPRINWISAIDSRNESKLQELNARMTNYYRSNRTYYRDIDGSAALWTDSRYLPYQEIAVAARDADNILEVGCGASNLLKFVPELQHRYTGIDFSSALIAQNKKKYPSAQFALIDKPTSYPFANGSFDLVFSIFVIEHTVYPHKFLEECARLLAPHGRMMMLTPSFLDADRLTSQRTGSLSSGRELLKEWKVLQALRSGVMSKVLIPRKCKQLRRKLPVFAVNVEPVCFHSAQFKPDVDAIYVTSGEEIRAYLSGLGLEVLANSKEVVGFERANELLFVSAKR